LPLSGILTRIHETLPETPFPSSTRAEEFIKGFQVFDKTGKGLIGAGELRYVLTQLGEKMSDAEVDELLKGVATV
jgi:calmodulin